MKKIIFLISFCFLYAEEKIDIVDFGIDGHMYDIEEKNFMTDVRERLKNLELDKDKIKQKIISERYKQSIGKTDLPFGKETIAYEEDNYQILNQEIRNPVGRLIHKKGDKVLLNTPTPLNICFIDGSNDIVLENQIKYFDAVVKKKENSHCVYMVSNKSVLELNKKYAPKIFYPSKPAYEKRFMVKSIPTYVHIKGTKKFFYSFPISMFKHEVKLK